MSTRTESQSTATTVGSTSEGVIEVRGLRKKYAGGKRALNGVDLTVCAGQVYGLVGANGAGKTTTIKILLGLLRSNGGYAHIFGKAFGKSRPSERARVASVSQEHTVYPSMTLEELCRYLEGFYPGWDQLFAEHLRNRFDLPDRTPVGRLSGGERRRASILLALATRTPVLVMDEPAANLDPLARRALLEELAGILAERESTTVLFSTHILGDLERIADKIGVMENGRMVHESSADELTSKLRRVQVIFVDGPVPDDFALEAQMGGAKIDGAVFTALSSIGEDGLAKIRGNPRLKVQTFPVSLEDALIDLMESRRADKA